MEYRRLGSSDVLVSAIGMGCVTFGREIDRAASFEILDHALARGITLFDTAATYGDGASERILGEWIGSRGIRPQIVVASKVHGQLTSSHILQSATESLDRLNVDQLDLLQLHHWDHRTPLQETLDGLRLVLQKGLARYVGCSNWNVSQISSALESAQSHDVPEMISVQPPYNLVQREIESDLIPLCVRHNIAVLTYSPLAAGFLTGKYRRDQKVPKGTRFDVIPGHQDIYFTDHGFRVVEQLRRLSESTGQTMVDLALAWILSRREVTSVLIGARNTGEVDQAFRAAESALHSTTRAKLDEL